MRLPNPDQAIVPAMKLRDYLLSHAESGGKAAFFGRLGYTVDNWERLAGDLRLYHLTADAEEVAPTKYGRKFVIPVPLTGPSGVTEIVLSVWIIRLGEDFPRFVTAYPDKGRK